MIIRHRIYHAEDDGSQISGGGQIPDIPIITQESNTTVVDVPISVNPAVEHAASRAISPAKDLGLAMPKLKGPKELGISDDDPKDLMRSIDNRLKGGAKAATPRGPDGKFLPKDSTPAPKTEVVQPQAAPKATPVAKAPPVKPAAAPQKIKIGDEEKTPEEWAQTLAELKGAKPEQAKPEQTEQPESKATDAPADDDDAKEQQFLEAFAESMGYTQDEIDDVLATGDPKKFSALIGRAMLDIRKSFADQINRQFEQIDAQLNGMAPLTDLQKQIEAARNEATFLNSNPDIAQHEQGKEEMQKVRAEYRTSYDTVKAKVANGTASQGEKGWLMLYESLTPDQQNEQVAQHVRSRLGIQKGATLTPAPAAKKPTAPASKPFGGDRPGGAGAGTKTLTRSEQIAQELANYTGG